MPKEITPSPIKVDKMYFGVASTSDDWIRHKRVAGEIETKRMLKMIGIGFVIGVFVGGSLGVMSVNL